MNLDTQLAEQSKILESHYDPTLLGGVKHCFQFVAESGESFFLNAGPEGFNFNTGAHPRPSVTLFVDRPNTVFDLLHGTLNGMDAFLHSRYRADGNIVLSQVLLYLFIDKATVHLSEVRD